MERSPYLKEGWWRASGRWTSCTWPRAPRLLAQSRQWVKAAAGSEGERGETGRRRAGDKRHEAGAALTVGEGVGWIQRRTKRDGDQTSRDGGDVSVATGSRGGQSETGIRRDETRPRDGVCVPDLLTRVFSTCENQREPGSRFPFRGLPNFEVTAGIFHYTGDGEAGFWPVNRPVLSLPNEASVNLCKGFVVRPC